MSSCVGVTPPSPEMHPMAANANAAETDRVVLRNEQLDGHPAGSAPYKLLGVYDNFVLVDATLCEFS